MEIHWIDLAIFIVYLFSMLGIGFFFYHKNESKEDYYVGKREMSAGHIGLSVVATDVGGGFSIGLGGLGFIMGISGSWMLFTGIIGAWLSVVFLIPKVYHHGRNHNFLSFPQVLEHYYDKRPAFIAGVISFIGYIGFTSSQVLAGAKLASATFQTITVTEAVLIIGIIAIVYTVAGGLKAVVYTDTVQWIILMSGLIFIGIPFGYLHLGGWAGIANYLPPHFFSLTNISLVQVINWMVTIVPIWFIGMTLYQRIYACRDERTAKKAWLIAGLFEWPVMAFLGTLLGLFGRIALEQGLLAGMGYHSVADIDSEIALPVFLRHILPVGLMGLVMSAYFSAIMSTADSCLMAASGNLMTDIIRPFHHKLGDSIRASQLFTLIIGVLAILIALQMQQVLEIMLYSYAFMVSGIFVPVLMLLINQKHSALAAILSMIAGGVTTLALILTGINLPLGLDPIVFGIAASLLVFQVAAFMDKRFQIRKASTQ
ncbi:MAG: sodium:solute symporter family protein [Saprospiraceae bacterium]|nr:sodium:solute symporter family protein [Saprospiraceae bacterium]